MSKSMDAMIPANHVLFICIRCGEEVTRWRGDELWADSLFSRLCRMDIARERAKRSGVRFTGYPPASVGGW